jgi:hypothetical protein
VDPDEIDI